MTTEEGEPQISAIEIGDTVLAWNEAENRLDYYPVTAVWSHDDPVVVNLLINGEWIKTTPEHPFYVEGKGWLPAEELAFGMQVRQSDSTTGLVWWQWLVHNACFKGGKYADLPTQLSDGTKVQRHHLIPDASSPLPTGPAPAIQMLASDHYSTSSYGWRNIPSAPFRQAMDSIVSNGNLRDAFAYGIRDVKRVAGAKYNQAIHEALQYAREIGFIAP